MQCKQVISFNNQIIVTVSQSNAIFVEQDGGKSAIERKQKDYALADFGTAILQKAVQRLEFYEFTNLKAHLPNLQSVHEFITSDRYIGNIRVEVSGTPEQIENLSAADRLQAATQVLAEIAAVIASDKIEYKGTKEFKPFMLKDKIKNSGAP